MSETGKASGKRKPTIETVAARAGVAISTVSRFLNGHSASKEAGARISKAVQELGYVPSWTARNLSRGRRGCVGVVVDSGRDLWCTQLLAGIQEELSRHDSALMLASLELNGTYDPHLVMRWVQEHRVDGVILIKPRHRDGSLIQACVAAATPLVMIAPEEHFAKVNVVQCDNEAAGAAVGNYVASLGHRKIAFASGPLHVIDTKRRLAGFRLALEELGIPLDAKRIFSCAGSGPEQGMQLAADLLSRPLDFTTLVTAHDAMALGFMYVAQQKGVHIPGDLSVVGFDNIPEAALLWPGLTTVAQPAGRMGRAACQLLFESITAPGEPRLLTFRMEMITRESAVRLAKRRSGFGVCATRG
jgi:DNA-binding LacI/PurR family transcriptional regulator